MQQNFGAVRFRTLAILKIRTLTSGAVGAIESGYRLETNRMIGPIAKSPTTTPMTKNKALRFTDGWLIGRPLRRAQIINQTAPAANIA